MQKILRVLAVLFVVTVGSIALAESPKVYSDYDDARRQAIESDQHLFVFLSQDGCPPCEVMWNKTVKPMAERGDFGGVVLAKIDIRKYPKIAGLLGLQNRTPSVVFYQNDNGWWTPTRRTGIVPASEVASWLEKARR